MSIITLTTDFGTKDHYVGALKGKIISEYAQATIVDISHHVDLFNAIEASYIIGASYSCFPKGSVHIIGVDSDENNKQIVMQWDDHFFICCDNGILSLLSQRIIPQRIIEINIHERLQEYATTMDIYVRVACHIAKGGLINVVGKEIKNLREVKSLKPEFIDSKTIKGNVIYIDHFGNVITDISKKIFQEFGKNRPFEINARGSKIKTIYNRYADLLIDNNDDPLLLDGKRMVIFNEGSLLEIGLFRGNHYSTGSASTLLGIKFGDSILVTFK